MKTASDFLHECAEVLDERGKQYDQPDGERSMGKAVKALEVITGKSLTEAEGWLFMQILKDVRQWSREKYHEDSAIDCVSYAALKGEALSRDDSTAEIKKDDGGWIDWGGGILPLNNHTKVTIKTRCGSEYSGRVDEFYWSNNGDIADIVKYKLVTKEQ